MATRITLIVTPDLAGAIDEAVSNVALSGLGADGTSEYEIANVDVIDNGDGSFTVEVECERLEGKFVGKDELLDTIQGELTQLDIEVDVS